ncbi:MAG: FkbM family methyltransferase [Spirochaetaceae bacterium]|nr:FkbM family methyltransferase [Spirochaetaceae bacterium]
MLLPYTARYRILQRFSLIDSGNFDKLTAVLIDMLEKESVFGFEKKEEMLKILKRYGAFSPKFLAIWLEKTPGEKPFFNFNGAIFPCLKGRDAEQFNYIFSDTFLFSVLFNDNYSAALVERLENFMSEGPYGYSAENFDVTVKADDVVIDAGAWIGDFSAYAASRGAASYAFEPSLATFKKLQETAALNGKSGGGGGIYPVNKGLGETDGEIELFMPDKYNTGANTIVETRSGLKSHSEKIKITTLDNFVHEQNLKKVDFIKADIEGAERDMLKGARGVLSEFAPKLALCTYHLPDDPQILESLIKDANPAYRVKHISKKLFAACR